jgi:hypothetical protein
MIEAEMEAILIKVAGIGLTTSHLGKTLAQMEPTLTKLVRMCFLLVNSDTEHSCTRIPSTACMSAAKAANTNL